MFIRLKIILMLSATLFLISCNKPAEDKSTPKTASMEAMVGLYPHSKIWALPENHGVFYANLNENQRSQCIQCHQSENNNTGVNCSSCHEAYPFAHNKRFKNGRHKKLAASYAGKCTACHQGYSKYISAENNNSCMGCHDSSTLEINWKKNPEGEPTK